MNASLHTIAAALDRPRERALLVEQMAASIPRFFDVSDHAMAVLALMRAGYSRAEFEPVLDDVIQRAVDLRTTQHQTERT